MILKGSQRGGGQDLAGHLMRADENEHVEIHEVRGFASDRLHEAFKEAYATSRATQCCQYLFSLSLNPPPEESVPVDAFESAIERIESKLGLSGQPRAIVFHEKEGRRHAHAVWSRIDADTMTARPLSFFKMKLRDIARSLFLEHGWRMPRGFLNSKERDPANFTLEEWQQAKRTRQDARAIKQMIQDCWAVSDGQRAFTAVLEERGFMLAKGDRRGHVAVDHTGEVYAIARWAGVKAKDVRAKLGDESGLPSVDEAKQRTAARMTPALQRLVKEAARERKRGLAALAHNKMVMRDRHRAERATLRNSQSARAREEAKARAAQFPSGLRGLWDCLTGRHRQIARENEIDAAFCKARDRTERQHLIDRQLSERRRLHEHVQALRKRHAAQTDSLRLELSCVSEIGADPAEMPTDRLLRVQRNKFTP